MPAKSVISKSKAREIRRLLRCGLTNDDVCFALNVSAAEVTAATTAGACHER